MDAVYGSEKRGQPPYDPLMMTKVLVYGYCVGVFSSRRIERRLVEDVAFRVLAADNQPNFRTISDFRKIHLKTLEGLFEQVLKIALEAGAMKVGRVALDGTKVKANASKHKAMSYDRMQEKEKQLKAEVKRLLEQAEAADAEEDALYGKDRTGDELPAELERRETRLKKIKEAKRAVEERARQKAAAEGKDPKQAEPKDKDQYNFTDPQSRIMKGADGFVQAYNAQAAVEPEFQFIVGQTVTQAANDKEQLIPMLATMEEQSGQRPDDVLADSGSGADDRNEDSIGHRWSQRSFQHADGVLPMKTGHRDEFVQNRLLLVPVGGSITRCHHLYQFPSCCLRSVASSICHSSLSQGRVTFFMRQRAALGNKSDESRRGI